MSPPDLLSCELMSPSSSSSLRMERELGKGVVGVVR